MVIEKHFTDNKKFSKFRDHYLSADDQEMSLIASFLKNKNILLGKGEKKSLEQNEKINIKNLRRSLYVVNNIKKNELINDENIAFLRPFKKNNLNKYKKLINQKSKNFYFKIV